MVTSPQPRRRHLGTWFVVLLGLLEIAVIVAFFELRGVAQQACTLAGVRPAAGIAAGAAGAGGGAGGMSLPMGGGQGVEPTDPPATGPPVTATAAAQPVGAADATAAGAQGGDAHVSGDTNQIVDPNCVARTTTALLASGTAAPSGPTCPPMKQPAALKAAEKQISQ